MNFSILALKKFPGIKLEFIIKIQKHSYFFFELNTPLELYLINRFPYLLDRQ